MSGNWILLNDEPKTGRRLEGRNMLHECDLRFLSLSDQRLQWFEEAVRVVKQSIDDGFRAKLRIERIVVYRQLRIQYYDVVSGRLTRTASTRGIVVPVKKTVFSHAAANGTRRFFTRRPLIASHIPCQIQLQRAEYDLSGTIAISKFTKAS